MMDFFKQKDDYVLLNLKVIPNAKKTEIIGETDGKLKIKISSPPVEGAANKEIIKFLSKKFKISKSKIELVKGEKSKNKVIKISEKVDISSLI